MQPIEYCLPSGFRIHDYEIITTLGVGNFGITYLARDNQLDVDVAIKEYFPAHLATRTSDNSATARTESSSSDFFWGLERFQQEAQTLAKFNHPNIVKVYRYLRANHTGYMVMAYENGKSLDSIIKTFDDHPSESYLRSLLAPLLDGLAHIHSAGILHRDIKPSNIFVRDSGSPVLIDFGSARAAMRQQNNQQLTTVVTPGFAPIEQYSKDTMQGPWTDIYALGGVMYLMATGSLPPESPSRVKKDPLMPATLSARQHYSRHFLEAIDMALVVFDEHRLRSVEQWQAMLVEKAPPVRTNPTLVAPIPSNNVLVEKKNQPPSSTGESAIPTTDHGKRRKSHHHFDLLNACRTIGGYIHERTIYTIVALAVILGGYFMDGLPYMNVLDSLLQHARYSVPLTKYATNDLALVVVDNKSIKEIGSWPWGNEKWAAIIDRLYSFHKPASIAVDVIFPPSTSWQDNKLAQSVRQKNIVSAYAFTNGDDRVQYSPFKQVVTKDGEWRSESKSGVVASMEGFAKQAKYAGHVNLTSDEDNIRRGIPLTLQYGDQYYPSFSSASAQSFLQIDGMSAKASSVTIGGKEIPSHDLRDGIFRFPRFSDESFQSISLIDALNGRNYPNDFSGKLLMIGVTADGVADNHSTDAGTVPGVYIHAAMTSALINGIRQGKTNAYTDVAQLLLAVFLIYLAPKLRVVGFVGLSMIGITALITVDTFSGIYGMQFLSIHYIYLIAAMLTANLLTRVVRKIS